MSIKFPNIKHFFSLFLAAVMMAGLLAVNAHAANANKITDYGDAYGHWAYHKIFNPFFLDGFFVAPCLFLCAGALIITIDLPARSCAALPKHDFAALAAKQFRCQKIAFLGLGGSRGLFIFCHPRLNPVMVGAQFAEDDYGYGTLWAYLVHDDVKLDFHVKKGEKFSITGYYLTNKRGGGEGSSVFYDSVFIRDLWFSPREDNSDPVDKEFIDEYFPGANYLVCCQGQEYDFDSTIRIVFADENGEPRTTPGFEDVTPTAYYAAPVAWAVGKNITNGTSTTTFSPSQNCTQAQILTFLYRADRGESAATAEDMDKAITWAREKGMIDDSFDGSTPCTRSTAVSYIWQAFDKPKAEKASSFTDVDKDADYAEAVSWAVEQGVTNGYGGNDTFAPDRVCNRGEIVTFLYRAYKK